MKTLGRINAEATANLGDDCTAYSDYDIELLLRDSDWDRGADAVRAEVERRIVRFLKNCVESLEGTGDRDERTTLSDLARIIDASNYTGCK